MDCPTLHTDRLIIRPLNIEDAAQIQKKFGTWNVIKIIGGGVPWPYPPDGAQKFLEDILPKMERGETYGWAITLKNNPDELIGQVAYRHITDKEDHRSFWLAENYWGQGFMTETIEAVQDFIFFDLGVDRIIVKNAKSNEGSRRVKEKTGAQLIHVGTGEFQDGSNEEETWEIRREDWAKIRERSFEPPSANKA